MLFLPNHSAVVKDEFPSGTAVQFKKTSPLFAEPLHCSKMMTWGATLYRCDAAKVQAPAYYTDKSRRFLHALAKSIGCSNSEAQPSLEQRDPLTNGDAPGYAWVASLGSDRGAYAGLYMMTSRAGNQRVEEPVLVVQAGAPLVSQQLYKMVADRQSYEPDTREEAISVLQTAMNAGVGESVVGPPMRVATTLTIDEFMKWPETRYAVNAGSRMRDSIAAAISKHLNLGILTIADSSAGVKGALLAVPALQTLSYHIEASLDGESFTYYAGSTNPQAVRNGMVLGQTPSLGPVVLQGAPSSRLARGQGWSVNEAVSSVNAFPIGTGRKRSDRQSVAAAQRGSFSPSLRRP